jgi:hydrogenase maturation protein HypF
MAEYNINEPVIGISYDGTGYGTDGRIWGSEAIIANLADFKRIGHFEYVPLPGGDLATKETWRSALAYLYKAFGPHWYKPDIPFLKEIDIFKAKKLIDAMDKGINSPLCCSAGRLFDAVAAILGICTESNYHAEAPLLLENYLDRSFKGTYSFLGDKEISFLPAIKEIIKDSSKKKPVEQIVTVFHNTIAAAAATQVKYALKTSTVKKIVIGGGTFQNKYLTEKFVHLLESLELEIYISNEVPCNDGGIALGQLAIAANKTGK